MIVPEAHDSVPGSLRFDLWRIAVSYSDLRNISNNTFNFVVFFFGVGELAMVI